jgi:hypothetical protein
MFGSRPIIKIVVGDFLGAAVDATILKIVVEEESEAVVALPCSWWRSATRMGSQVLGFPALLLYLDGDNEATWTALESGEVHMYPEVWRTDAGAARPRQLHRGSALPARVTLEEVRLIDSRY